jgi:type II secretory pathway component GspD/PulD (secretin)
MATVANSAPRGAHFSLIADVTPTAEAESPAAPDNAPAEAAKESASALPPGAQAAGAPQNQAPPINVTVTPDGRIVISSDDVAALDQLQDLISELEPPRKHFEVFQLYNSRASAVSLNLEEYFADELGEDDNDFPWWYDEMPQQEEAATMGKRRKLRFIWDPDTNTIVAQNASPAQLEIIRKLIEIYDQPVDEEAVSKRLTDVITIKYSRAQDIATAIKEVYRDLLSSKDKEFQSKDGERDGGQSRSESRWRFGSSSSNQKSAPMKLSFEGALSIGVDEISNTIIVSAEEQIAKNVRELATALDEKAKPNTIVQVHELRGTMDPEEMQDALSDLLSQPWPGGKPLQLRNQEGRNGDNNNRDRGDRGDRGRGDRGDRGRNRD